MGLSEELAAVNRVLDARDVHRARELIAPLLTAHSESANVLWTAGRFLGLLGAHQQAAAQFRRAAQLDAQLSHVEFAVKGKTIRLRDVPGSTWAAEVLDEFGRGMYGLADLTFAPNDIAVDVGAHLGGVSIILAALNPHIRIIAIEPASSNYASLCANVKENGLMNVTAVNKAVMGERGEMTLMWSSTATAGSTIGLSDASVRAREQMGWSGETVSCVTLDDVFAEYGIERCSWLKLDCESAEWEILAKSNVLDRVDRMAIELHLPASRQAEGEEALIREFASLFERISPRPTATVASTLWVIDR
jgi:FkbM family methyltransferase